MVHTLSIRALGSIALAAALFFISFVTTSAATFEEYPGSPVFDYSGVSGTFDQMRVSGPEIIKVGSDYWMYYTGLGNGNPTQIGLATSSDGINWTRHPNNPVFSCAENTTTNCTTGGVWSSFRTQVVNVIEENGVYKMWYHGDNVNLNGKGRIGYATSSDGVNWTPYANNYIWPDNANDSFGVYTVVPFNGEYYMYFRDQNNTLPLRLATSSDGITWTEHPQSPILNMLPDGFSVIDGKIYMINRDEHIGVSTDGITFEFDETQSVIDWTDRGSCTFIKEGDVVKMWYSHNQGIPASPMQRLQQMC